MNLKTTRRWRQCLALLVCLQATLARADKFTYVDEKGKQQEVEASLYATGSGVMALELADGELRVVPEGVISQRVPGDDPKPMSPEDKLKQLKQEFGEEKFRGIVSGPYVVGVILMAPLLKTSEKRVEASLKKSAAYLRTIEKTFEGFVRSAKLVPQKPKFPLVVLIFETDDIFEDFTTKDTGGDGLSAGNIAGFYSQLTNLLYIRMSECYTFATPLHEAIHQQCFNTGVLQRLAPLPKWFVEGMATGFEGNGEKIRADPLKLNQSYAKQIAMSQRIPGDLDWDIVSTVDQAFVGDIFAGEAYFHAWSMHWLLFSKHREDYTKFLKSMSAVPPLSERKPEAHQTAFEAAFGKRANKFQSEFLPAFLVAVKKEKFIPDRDDLPGVISRHINLAGVEVMAESDGQSIAVKGALKNISPLRDMTYYVTVMTESGSYADWLIPKLAINGTTPLRFQQLTKVAPGTTGGPGRTFSVRVHAVPADSDEAKQWARGQLPSVLPRRTRR
jgi:hypothetical protein